MQINIIYQIKDLNFAFLVEKSVIFVFLEVVFEFLNIYFFSESFISGGHKSYTKLINGGISQLSIKFRLFLTSMIA